MRRRIWIFALLILLIVLIGKPGTRVKIATQTIRTNLPFIGKNIPQTTPPLIKKGVALIHVSPVSDIDTLNATWCYNWSPNPDCGVHEAVPMIWGRNVEDAVGGNSQFILGFNEPDMENQSNLSPDEAAILWRRIEERFPFPRQLVSPAVTGYGLKWLQDWYAAYRLRYGAPPRVNVLAYHYYGFYVFDFNRVLGEFKSLSIQWGVPIWITEFAVFGNVVNGQTCAGHGIEEGLANLRGVMESIKNEPRVQRYAYYAPRIDINDPAQIIPPPQCNAPLLDLSSGLRNAWGDIYMGY